MAKAPPLCYDKHIRKGGAFMFQKEFGLIRACYIKTDKLVQPKRPKGTFMMRNGLRSL